MKTIWVKQGFGSLWNITDESEKADIEINNLYIEVIDVANRVRNDEVVQKSIYSDCSGGDVKLYYGSGENVSEFIEKCAEKWSVQIENPLHCMFATNQMVAEYSGFPNVYEAFKRAEIYRGIGYKQLNSELLSHDIIHLGRVQAILYRLIKIYTEVREEKQPLRDILPSDKYRNMSFLDLKLLIASLRAIDGNTLDRDYSSAYPAKVIIEKDWLRTENWCIPRRHGNIMSDEFTPYPKNPLIQQFFANIGRTDTIGSGVRNLYKYTPMYSDGGKPELIEDDVFRINIPLDRIAADEATEQKTLSEREQKIYNMICENLHLSVEQVMAELDISRSTVFRDYAKIKKVTGAVYDKKTSTWTL